jgi:hypothetical protein
MSNELIASSHAQVVTSFPTTLAQPSRGGIILSNFSAGASSITVTMLGGEQVVISLGTAAASNNPVWLPLQITAINAAANLGTVVALWS